ncbi:hypothetical protein SAMN04487897_10614 [Paenibacillus sp. yr247]|nr:hypothetical protein SAMN04487897_10614 [Paenibacillus sp. yr247]
MKWKRWLFKCACITCITILTTSYTARMIGTMYIEEINKELHISLPANSFHVSGLNPIPNNLHGPSSNPTFLNITNNQSGPHKGKD